MLLTKPKQYTFQIIGLLALLFYGNQSLAKEFKITNDSEAYKAIGSIKDKINDLKLADCLDISESLLQYGLNRKKPFFIAQAYNSIGICYEEMRDLKNAETYYIKALEVAKNTTDYRLLNFIYSNLANLYFYHEIDKNKAIQNYETAYKYALITKDSIDIVYSKIGLVQAYFDADKINIGYKHLQEVAPYVTSLNDTEFYILFYSLKASYYKELKNYSLAEENYAKLVTYLEKIESDYQKSYSVDIYHEMYEFYRDNNQNELALKYLERHDEVEDDLANKEKNRQIKIFGSPVEARLSNLKMQKIETDKKLQEIQLQKSNLINKIIIILIVCMLVIIIIISIYSLLTKKINKDLKIANEALQLSMVEAESANQAKSKFIATITHELRTPLYGVIGITNILANEYQDLKESQHLKSLEFSAKYLLQLVNDVLIMSKIDDTEIKLNTEIFNVEQELNTIVNSLQLIAQNTKNVLTFNPIHPIPKLIESDKIRLSQIIINLISNSLKFTKEGNVSLEVKQLHQNNNLFLEFKVKDNGIGIPKALHDKVFDKFVQIERKEDDYQGTGLGLTIVKKLVHLFKGIISLESEEGVGTCVTFVIPFTIATDDFVAKKPVLFTNFSQKNYKVLVIEDNKINQVVTRKILESNAMECVILDDGFQAIELLKTKSFDVILMDINMPKINGIETTKILRSNGITTPVIAVTAFEKNQIGEDIYAIGFNDIIIKPFNSHDLFDKISQYNK